MFVRNFREPCQNVIAKVLYTLWYYCEHIYHGLFSPHDLVLFSEETVLFLSIEYAKNDSTVDFDIFSFMSNKKVKVFLSFQHQAAHQQLQMEQTVTSITQNNNVLLFI